MITRFSLPEKILLANNVIPHPFADAAVHVCMSRAMATAVRVGLCNALTGDDQSSAALARQTQCSERGVELVLNCLCAIGYCQHSSSGYRYTKRGLKFLSADSDYCMQNFIKFSDWSNNRLENLDDTVRDGTTPTINLDNFTADEWELFSRAMIDIARTNVAEVTRAITLGSNARTLLDCAGSHGLYSIALCEKYPQLNATVMDFEAVRPYADECITKHAMQSKVRFLAGDMLKDPLPEQNDVALLFNIIHGFSLERNAELIARIYASLKDGGQLYILDQIKGMGGASQLSQATVSFMAINLFHQANGNTYSVSEIEHIATKAGFKLIRVSKLHAPGFGLCLLQK